MKVNEQGRMRIERLVAHRELQYLRSIGHPDPGYEAERYEKFNEARALLSKLNKRQRKARKRGRRQVPA